MHNLHHHRKLMQIGCQKCAGTKMRKCLVRNLRRDWYRLRWWYYWSRSCWWLYWWSPFTIIPWPGHIYHWNSWGNLRPWWIIIGWTCHLIGSLIWNYLPFLVYMKYFFLIRLNLLLFIYCSKIIFWNWW